MAFMGFLFQQQPEHMLSWMIIKHPLSKTQIIVLIQSAIQHNLNLTLS